MKTVAKFIIGVRVIVGLCKLINTAVPAQQLILSSVGTSVWLTLTYLCSPVKLVINGAHFNSTTSGIRASTC